MDNLKDSTNKFTMGFLSSPEYPRVGEVVVGRWVHTRYAAAEDKRIPVGIIVRLAVLQISRLASRKSPILYGCQWAVAAMIR